ncbi:hypothetical protein K435DRAFT_848614 [Dendrothele bispora CBS 962.96]|uniref:Uncharacterized protein n=1 Tax=Dendrothele bispora (strain CBS 962.96) TaxID=1314807 RepID=A0A4S8MUM5_DENBC|nr:hypothetical protein K435DRAFT_848614 [Dendrothele bispora CBS 962.96]
MIQALNNTYLDFDSIAAWKRKKELHLYTPTTSSHKSHFPSQSPIPAVVNPTHPFLPVPSHSQQPEPKPQSILQLLYLKSSINPGASVSLTYSVRISSSSWVATGKLPDLYGSHTGDGNEGANDSTVPKAKPKEKPQSAPSSSSTTTSGNDEGLGGLLGGLVGRSREGTYGSMRVRGIFRFRREDDRFGIRAVERVQTRAWESQMDRNATIAEESSSGEGVVVAEVE